MKKIKVLFAAAEAAPFVKSGGLGDVVGSLPAELIKNNCEVSVILPLYEGINNELRSKFTFVTNIFVPVAWRNQYCGIFKYENAGVVWYFIDNEYYFKRGNALYGCYDDAERFAFFSRAVLEILPHINLLPDILHCHDWHTALIPIYYKLLYFDKAFYKGIKTVFTIHNIEYQGVFGGEIVENVLGLSQKEFHNGFLEHNSSVNFMKAALVCCDRITTVSPSYSEEIKTPEFAHGLDSVLRQEAGKVSGIINGIDVMTYNPETDKKLFSTFSQKNMSGKCKNKEHLQELVNLPKNPDVPVVGMVTRLVSHKGIDLVCSVIDELLSDDIELVIIGTGDWKYEQFLSDKQWQYPFKLSVNIAFSAELAQKIYGGSDMFLMPSKSEPCGLAQMIALRYGTVPIVRETGGLRDSVTPYNRDTEKGNGFSFSGYNAYDMLRVVREACEFYKDKKIWDRIIKNGMETDFSWKEPAKEYYKLYDQLLDR